MLHTTSCYLRTLRLLTAVLIPYLPETVLQLNLVYTLVILLLLFPMDLTYSILTFEVPNPMFISFCLNRYEESQCETLCNTGSIYYYYYY